MRLTVNGRDFSAEPELSVEALVEVLTAAQGG
jgi:hypothetical protein